MKKTKKKGIKRASPSKTFAYEPLGDRVLVKEREAEESLKTKSGIYIPESASKDSSLKQGKIIAVGEGRYEDGKLIPLGVRVGDTVSYQWGEKVILDGVDYVLVRFGEIALKHN